MPGGDPLKSPAEAGTTPLAVVLIDPLAVVREGIGLLIETQPDMEVLAQAGSSEEGLQALDGSSTGRPVIILVALELEDESGPFSLIRNIRERHPDAIILASAAASSRAAISQALAFGADGFVHKRTDPVQFLDALRRAGQGETVVTGLTRDLPPVPSPEDGPVRELTGRQRQILSLVEEGLTARQIGGRLGVTERTVTTHLHRIYRKLGVSGRMAALRAAGDRGLL